MWYSGIGNFVDLVCHDVRVPLELLSFLTLKGNFFSLVFCKHQATLTFIVEFSYYVNMASTRCVAYGTLTNTIFLVLSAQNSVWCMYTICACQGQRVVLFLTNNTSSYRCTGTTFVWSRRLLSCFAHQVDSNTKHRSSDLRLDF